MDYENRDYENLFSNVMQPAIRGIEKLVAGGSVVRGQALGQITSSKSMTALDADNNDGSNTIYAIAAETIDNSAGSTPVDILVYYSGQFNEAALTFASGETAATHKSAARKLNIFFEKTI